MKLLDRQDVFKQYKILASHIHGIQQSFYDEDEEESYTSKFDTISLTVKDYNTHNFCVRVASDQKALHPLEISGKLKALFTEIDCEALILIPFIKLDFFSSKNSTYADIAEAYKNLATHIPTKTHTEALEVSLTDLNEFVHIIYTLATEDLNFPEFTVWFDKQQRFAFFICRYGNLHITDYTDGTLVTESLFLKHDFKLDDYPQFE
ncbi:hypothetical protein [Croceibacter atlanticus]|uniref:hypothetical protein n=1 Tax=Croceibacter atlanticus TaxID=313588 RepID=UPI0030F616F7